MFYDLIFFIIVSGIIWVIDINIIRSETDRIADITCANHAEIILTNYEKHLTKNVIIGKTPWGDLCSINDLNKEFESIVRAHMNETVKVYYKIIHRGTFIFSETNQVISIIPIYKKNRR